MSPRAVGLLVGLLAAGAPVMLAGQAGRISYESFAMPNGLRVVYSEDHSTPVVTVDLWYHAGARNERPGRSGFAHLFEHMMFQGSAHVKKSEHFQLVERAGGTLNGSTHDDYTNYYETIPSNRLNLALWLEADRMRSLAVTQENLENQRATVKEEKRLRVDNQPYAPTFRSAILWPFDSATCFAYAHSTMGSMEDLDAARLEDVQAYFRPRGIEILHRAHGGVRVGEARRAVEGPEDGAAEGRRVRLVVDAQPLFLFDRGPLVLQVLLRDGERAHSVRFEPEGEVEPVGRNRLVVV